MDLSIIIPVLNEAKKVENDIAAASKFLLANNFLGEIIISDDGSEDDTVSVARQTKILPGVTVKILESKEHRGKGFAVKQGVFNSAGKFVVFMDSGLCVPLNYIKDGLNLLENNECDFAHGSRFLPQSKIIRAHLISRQISSFLFRNIISFLMSLPPALTDTQCGFKIYKGDVARFLYSKVITAGFMFDVEIIKRAKQNGYRILEFPIQWKADPDSRLSQMRMPKRLFLELIRIKTALRKEQREKRIKAE